MKKTGILIVLLVLVVILAAGSMFTVAEDEYACTVRFSKIIDTTSEAGLHFKLPFVDSVKYFTDATQLYDIPPSEVLTSDKQNMTVDCYILWRISDPKLFYQTLGSTAKAEERRGVRRQAGGRRRAGVHASAGGGLRHPGQEGLLRIFSGAGCPEGQPERRRKNRHSGRQFRACQDPYGRKIEIS